MAVNQIKTSYSTKVLEFKSILLNKYQSEIPDFDGNMSQHIVTH